MKISQKKVFLVGPMGAGKTSIGHQLAGQIGLPFFDTDLEIENRCGANIAWIFDKEGESGFRKRETDVLKQLVQKPSYLIATGGGIIMRECNRKILASEGFVIYLHISVEKQYLRTLHDTKRPLLQNTDKKQVLSDLFEQRDPLYRKVADLVIDVDNLELKKVVKKIVSEI